MIESTDEHMHFAGYKFGFAPPLHLTYLMWKRGVGFRVGTTQMYNANQQKPTLGFRSRAFSEYADAVWVVSTHAEDADARLAETLLSLRYGLPTLPFVARVGRSNKQSVVADQDKIDAVFAAMDTRGRRSAALE